MLPDIEPNFAVIADVPALVPVANPFVSIVATEFVADVQVTEDVRSLVVLSEYVPVAVSCWVVLLTIDGATGVTAIDDSVGSL